MNPRHPTQEGIYVSKETLKDPKELKRIAESAKEFGKSLNRGMMEVHRKVTAKR